MFGSVREMPLHGDGTCAAGIGSGFPSRRPSEESILFFSFFFFSKISRTAVIEQSSFTARVGFGLVQKRSCSGIFPSAAFLWLSGAAGFGPSQAHGEMIPVNESVPESHSSHCRRTIAARRGGFDPCCCNHKDAPKTLVHNHTISARSHPVGLCPTRFPSPFVFPVAFPNNIK